MILMFRAGVVALLLQVAGALLLVSKTSPKPLKLNDTAAGHEHNASVSLANFSKAVKSTGWTFPDWYNAYSTGRGIWKWSNAIDAYQKHLAGFIGLPIHMGEVGVQSGGSLIMWHSVIGAQCHVYGLDINPASMKFQDATTTIVIGDQEDPAMWHQFFASTVKVPLSILIDDGGHTPGQMFVTLREVFPQLTVNGVIAIEDIHGLHYVDSFFRPAAGFLATQNDAGKLSSVHVYPFLLVASREQAPQLPLVGKNEVVKKFGDIWPAITRNPGGHVTFPNPSPVAFFNRQFMEEVFAYFGNLHGGSWTSVPEGCHSTAAAVCSVTVGNTPMQSAVTGVHIYSDRLVVDVATSPPVIAAVRHGTEWLKSSVER